MEVIPMEIIPLQPNSARPRPVHPHRLVNAANIRLDVEKERRRNYCEKCDFPGERFLFRTPKYVENEMIESSNAS